MERMNRKTLLWDVFVLIASIALLHTLASVYSLYWSVWWFDIVLHTLGGAWAFLLSVWLLYFSGYVSGGSKTKYSAFWKGLGLAILIGVLWEVFEYYMGATYADDYMIDTICDIVSDTAGALMASLYFLRRFNRR